MPSKVKKSKVVPEGTNGRASPVYADSLEQIPLQTSEAMTGSRCEKSKMTISSHLCPICKHSPCSCNDSMHEMLESPDQILGIGLNLGLILPTGVVDIKVNPSMNLSMPPVNLCSLLEAQDRTNISVPGGGESFHQSMKPNKPGKKMLSLQGINKSCLPNMNQESLHSNLLPKSMNHNDIERFKKEAMGEDVLIEPLIDSKEHLRKKFAGSSTTCQPDLHEKSSRVLNGTNVVQLNKVQMLNLLQGNKQFSDVLRKKKQKQDAITESFMRRKCLCPLKEEEDDLGGDLDHQFLTSLQCCHVSSKDYLEALGKREVSLGPTPSVELAEASTSALALVGVSRSVQTSLQGSVEALPSLSLCQLEQESEATCRYSQVGPVLSATTEQPSKKSMDSRYSKAQRSSKYQETYKSRPELSSVESVEQEETCSTTDAVVQTSFPFPQLEGPPTPKEPCPEKIPKMPVPRHPPCRKFSWERAELEQKISMDFTKDEVHSFAYKLAFGRTCDVMRIHDETPTETASSRMSLPTPRGGRVRPMVKPPEPPRRIPGNTRPLGYAKICQLLKEGECPTKPERPKTQGGCTQFQVRKEYGRIVNDRNIKARRADTQGSSKKGSMICSGLMHQESQENMPHPCCCSLQSPKPVAPQQDSFLNPPLQYPLKAQPFVMPQPCGCTHGEE